nr:uncharacterized protein LOC113802727 [Penaeus vannamei]
MSEETAPIPRPSQSAIDAGTIRQVVTVILVDRHITVRQLAQVIKVSVGTVDKIIHDHWHKQMLSAHWVPRLLTPFQEEEQVHCTMTLLPMYCRYRSLLRFTATEIMGSYQYQEAWDVDQYIRFLQINTPVRNSHIAQTEMRSCGYNIF